MGVKKTLPVLGVIVLLQIVYAENAKVHIQKLKAFIPILETDTKVYSLAPVKAYPHRAEEICQESNGHLLTFQSLEEYETLISKLKEIKADLIWTAGISFSNSSVEDLLLWNETMEPITFTNFEDIPEPQDVVRDSRKTKDRNKYGKNDDDCSCPCSTTPMPFTRAPCKRPVCNITTPNPPCRQIGQQNCTLLRDPECKVKQNNCTVDCSEQCRVVEQPVCTVKFNSSRCTLKQPGPCELSKPNCTVVPGQCTSVQDECIQQEGSCTPVIRPCNYSCAHQECTTVSPPCITTQPPCVTTTTTVPCEPSTPRPGCDIQRKCENGTRTKRSNDVTVICQYFEVCPNITRPVPTPPSCEPIEVCPPEVITCPPPVSSCTRPFVDCSSEICRSNVQICLAPKIICPPVRIICDPAEIKCKATAKNCPEPEVFCEEPQTECTKPKIICPDVVVHCDPVITTCGHAPVTCSNPEMDCKEPEITCEDSVTCDEPPPASYNNCKCTGKKCPRKPKTKPTMKVRDSLMLPEGTEFIEKTMCLAMNKDSNFKWVRQSCYLEHNFICQNERTTSKNPEKTKQASLWNYFI